MYYFIVRYFRFLLLLQKKAAKKTSFCFGRMVYFALRRPTRGLEILGVVFRPLWD